jgi:uncharacterized membrane protein
MNWNQLYGIRSHLKSSLWIVPFIAIPVEFVVAWMLRGVNAWLGWSFLGFSPTGSQALLGALITATMGFVVFTFASLLVAIQVASVQLTPRIIATTLLQDRIVSCAAGLFVFTFLFCVSTAGRIDTKVDQLAVFVAACLGVACIAALLFLIDYAAKLLRPITILARVGRRGIDVIQSVYPEVGDGTDRNENWRESIDDPPIRTILHQGASQIVLAVNVAALLAEAEKSNGVIEFVPQVGDFVAVDEPLFNLRGGAASLADQGLRANVAFGPERTMEQDPTFAFRIVVDLALKALSPAINDPTTAVLAIDQLHRLLRVVGMRYLGTDGIRDKSGRLRVIVRTPNWEDFVHLAFPEIRYCGSNNIQIVRRMRAMIENLMQTLPGDRLPVLQQELAALDREIEKHFDTAEDLMLARIPDSQGLGGRSGERR